MFFESLFILFVPIPAKVCLKCVGCGCYTEIFYGLHVFNFLGNYSWIIFIVSLIGIYLLACLVYRSDKATNQLSYGARKFYLIALIFFLTLMCFLYGLSYLFYSQQAPRRENQPPQIEQPVDLLDSVMLKIPVIKYKEPGNMLSDPIISGYTNKVVEMGSEFVIESATLGYMLKSQVGDVQLKLVEVKDNSVVVDVLADKRFDGKFYPRKNIEKVEIKNGSCISAFPLVMDVFYEYCFNIEKENGKTALMYRIQNYTIMPTR